MARKRMIDPKFWADDEIIELTHMQRLLFIGIWNFADDSGIIKNAPKSIKASIFPADNIKFTELVSSINELVSRGLLECNDDDTLLRVANWSEYQKINRPQPSKYQQFKAVVGIHGTFSEHSVNDPTKSDTHSLLIEKNRIEQNRIKQNRKELLKENNSEPLQQVEDASPPNNTKLDKISYSDKIDKYFNNIDPTIIKSWSDAYPTLNINEELKKSKAWLLSNPSSHKKKFSRFVNNWLSNARPDTSNGGNLSIYRNASNESKTYQAYMDDAKDNMADQTDVSKIMKDTVDKLKKRKRTDGK